MLQTNNKITVIIKINIVLIILIAASCKETIRDENKLPSDIEIPSTSMKLVEAMYGANGIERRFETIKTNQEVIDRINFSELFYSQGCTFNNNTCYKFYYKGNEFHYYHSYCKDEAFGLGIAYLYILKFDRLVVRETIGIHGGAIYEYELLP